MNKLMTFFRRAPKAKSARRPDPTASFTPRDWADLPVYHPASDDSRR